MLLYIRKGFDTMGLFSRLFGSKKKDNKYKLGMNKTRTGVLGNLKKLLSSKKIIDDELFDELEEMFIMADIGVDTVIDFIDGLKDEVKNKKLTDPKLLQEMIMDRMFEIYLNGEIVNANLNLNKNGLSVILFVGVNGVGKTTTIAKIANSYKNQGKKVLLAAGDTFRAGAVAQLDVWAKRVGVDIVTKPDGSDPSSVMFEAVKKAKDENYDILLCDTAGRLQNKVNLMNELAKMKRVIQKECPDAPHETLLVIDATTGQNGMSQAKAFKEVTDVSGVILTKLDGTSKGGIVLAIRHELGIPIKYIGLGEGIDDLEVFDIEQYLYGLFADFFEE
jgi:fused signal recognition particle receptor